MGNCEKGTDLWYVVNDLVKSLCWLASRNIDFQQAKGCSVGIVVAMTVRVAVVGDDP